MKIIFHDPRRPSQFHIYAVEGANKAADAHVREKLKVLPEAPPRDYSKIIRDIRGECVPARGTPVEKYLRSRGITLEVPAVPEVSPASVPHRDQVALAGDGR